MANPETTWWEQSSGSEPNKNFIGLRFWVPDIGPDPKETSEQPDSTSTTQNDANLSAPPKDGSAEAKPAQTEKDAPDEKVFHGPGESRIVVTPTTVSYNGYSTSKKTLYHTTLELAGEVDPKSATCKFTSGLPTATVQVRKKKLDEEDWEVLVKDKLGFLRTDFTMMCAVLDAKDREDEREESGPSSLDFNFAEQMSRGMPGAEGMGIGDFGQAQVGDDDNEMPELEDEGEDEEEGAETSTGKPKIEELP